MRPDIASIAANLFHSPLRHDVEPVDWTPQLPVDGPDDIDIPEHQYHGRREKAKDRHHLVKSTEGVLDSTPVIASQRRRVGRTAKELLMTREGTTGQHHRQEAVI